MPTIAGVLDYRCAPAAGPLSLGPYGDGPSGRFVCMLDGYLDNAGELARELGLSVTTSPELVVGEGYGRSGEAVLERLRGDFSLVLWDREQRRGLIACDQFGARSMFVRSTGSRLYFASDLRPLLELLPIRPGPDHTAVVEYLSLQPFAQSRTMYEGVRQLPPAHAMRFEESGWEGFRYWRPRYTGVVDGSADELAEEVKRVMTAAVQRRLASRGITAITMSGGLDSTTVAALAQQLSPQSVRSYSATMPDFPDEDESFYVQRMQEFTGISARTLPTRPRGIVAAGLEGLRARSLPAVTTTDFKRQPLYAAARTDGAGIVLGGDGGDEVFGTRTALIGDRLMQGRLVSAVALGRRHPGIVEPPPLHRVLRGVLEIGYDAYRPHVLEDLVRRRRGPAESAPWIRAADAQLLFEARDQTSWKRLAGPRWWARLADGITRNHARLGMYDEMRRSVAQHGLDYRHPLLDYELVDLALRLPPELSFGPGLNRPLLRRAMRGSLPEEVRTRPTKTNFVPLALYALLDELPLIKDVVGAPDAEINRYTERDTVASLLDGTLTGGRLDGAWLDRVWRLFMAECWLREQADSEYSEKLRKCSDSTVGNGATKAGANGIGRPFSHLVPPMERT